VVTLEDTAAARKDVVAVGGGTGEAQPGHRGGDGRTIRRMAEDQDEGGAGGEDERDGEDPGDGVVDAAPDPGAAEDEGDDEGGDEGEPDGTPAASPYDAVLDDEDDEDADGDGEDDDEIVYELDDWSGESRLLADGLLENAGIARVWQGGTLVVRAEDEDAVDEIVDNVDAMATPALDPDAAKIAYEVADWTDAQRTGLAHRLGDAGIPYEWDEQGDLLVLEEDEARVEELFDSIESPDELDAGLEEEDDGGLAAQEVLSDLFVSSDRLMHDARDADGVLTFVDAAARARTLSLPFGFERGIWDEIVARAGALAGDFENDVEDDDLIVERASELRNLLRGYV